MDVEYLSVGTELVSTEKFTEKWRQLIADVRKIYHGEITYSVNWDRYGDVSFWDDLDYIVVPWNPAHHIKSASLRSQKPNRIKPDFVS